MKKNQIWTPSGPTFVPNFEGLLVPLTLKNLENLEIGNNYLY